MKVMKEIKECPDCNGIGEVDIEDYVECPTCEGAGEVEKGTKSWLQNLLESKE